MSQATEFELTELVNNFLKENRITETIILLLDPETRGTKIIREFDYYE